MRPPCLRRSAFCLAVLLLLVSRVDAAVTFSNTARLSVNVGSDGPQSIAVVDVNKDNRPDIIAVDQDNDQVNVFLNDGQGGFAGAPNQFNVGAGPVAVGTGDFDVDGNIDIVTVNGDSNTVTIIFGDSSGAFNLARQDYPVDQLPVGVAVADYNNDGKPDLAVLSDTTVYLLLSNGDTTFSPASPASIGTRGTGGTAIAQGLLNGDSFPDLVISNIDSDNVSVFVGNGNGTFKAAKNYNTGSGPDGLVIGDWDGDAKQDIAVVDSTEGADQNVSLLYGNGDGTFQDPVPTTAQTDSIAIAKADLDASGRLDFAVTNTSGDNTIAVMLYDPSAPNAEAGYALQDIIRGLALTPGQVAIQSADLNADARPDLVAVNADTDTIGVFINTTGTTGTATPSTAPAGSPTPTTPGATPTPSAPPASATPTPTRTPTATPTAIPVPYGVCSTNQAGQPSIGGQPVAVGVGLFKNLNPRRQFFAVADQSGNRIVILTAQITTGAADPCAVLGLQHGIDVSGVTAPVGLLVQDLDGDNNDDLAVIGSGGLSIFYGDGAGGFSAGTHNPMPAGSQPHTLAVADFNRDGRLDVIVADAASNNAWLFLSSGTRSFADGCPIPVNRHAGLVITQDLNLDGRPDFAVASAQTTDLSVFLQNPPATATPGTLPSCTTLAASFRGLTPQVLPGTPQSMVVGSFDLSDQIPDLAIAMSSTGANGSLVVYLGRAGTGGDVIYQRQTPVPVPSPSILGQASMPSAMGSGDITRDGRNDLVVADRNNDEVALFFADTNGAFGSAILLPVSGRVPVGLVMQDIDNDGRPDVVVANQGDGSVSFLISSKPPPTPTPPPTATSTPSATSTQSGTPTVTPTSTPSQTASATVTGTRTRAPTATFTVTSTPTLKPGAIGLTGSCAVDPNRSTSPGIYEVSVVGAAFAVYRRRARRLRRTQRVE